MTTLHDAWTISKAARLLRELQHRLIDLCEKQVVIPDLEEACGRGSSRRFSARNMLEFALALRLRQLMIPVAPVAAILYVLRTLARKVAREIPTFRLPHSLVEPGTRSSALSSAMAKGSYMACCLQGGERERLLRSCAPQTSAP